jgi:multicomponent Na+:H+ antiporter subunit E
MISHLFLRLGFWLLLTADFSVINITIGVITAFVLPRKKGPHLPLIAWFKGAWKVLKLLPIAYLEAFSLLIHPYTDEEVTTRPIGMGRNPWLLFLEIFLINFSPKSIVLQVDKHRRIHIHKIRHRNRS